MSDIRARLLAAFQVEHKEQLEALRALVTTLERGAATAADREELFRHAHSLRAAARACDFPTVEAVGQRLEALFGQVRKGGPVPAKGVLDAVRLALNAVEDWALGLTADASPPEPAAALAALDRALAARPPAAAPAVPDDLTAKLLAAFQVEHKEHLEGIRALVGEIERGGAADPGAGVDEAFRRAHSLKGAARLAELHGAEGVAHRLETLFARVQEKALGLSPDVVRVIYHSLDTIEDCAAALLTGGLVPEVGPMLEAIDRVLAGGAAGTGNGVAAPAPPRPAPPAASPVAPPAAAPAALPPEEAPRPAPGFQGVETVRVSAENLDRLLRSTGQLLTESLRQSLVARELTDLSRQLADLEKEGEAVRNTCGPALRQLGEAPGLDRLARYLTRVEQQVRALARQARAARTLQQRSAWTLRLLGGQLQQDVRRVRTVPAESVFQGFRKMMRDLARTEGKELEFRASGFDIEADRMVLQALKDPLMHILCNAVSHGLEPPEERQRQGKSPAGLVTLRLEAAGNRLRVAVEDDGRGIDSRQVGEAAVRRGLLSAADAAALPREELTRLIFRPGFSTARQVTGVSGRGMGLSVVYEAVARLQGEVHLPPPAGAGTALVIIVPLSISTQRLLLVACRGQTYAVPLHAVERLLRVKVQDVETVEGKPMILVAGEPIPLLSLAALLGMGEAGVSVSDGHVPLMILRSGARRVAVAADGFLGERESLIKELDPPAAHLAKLAGGILLEDGTVALVLNPAELVLMSRAVDKAPLLLATPTAARAAQTVLVVDDSLTTRTLEKSILEAHGYEVRIAMDGVEALAQLAGAPVDLVITDVEMPRMNGFRLLEEMKKDPRLAQTPVIVVTSLEKREDQERGLALGADAYIVKRKFDHQELLDVIRQII